MKNPLVSIVVPIYNVEKYLDVCLLSIKNQLYKNIEVIMVNDGSKDSSRIIAQKYASNDSRFILLDKENGGLSSARNFGLDYANGDYISFVDSDDFVSKRYVLSLLNSFDDNTDIVIGDYVIYNSSTKESFIHGLQYSVGEYSSIYEKKKIISAMFDGLSVMSVWKNMYRVTFLRKHNLRFVSERIVYAEDMLFHAEAYAVAEKIKVIPDKVFYHTFNPTSLSQGYRSNLFEMNMELHNRITDILKKYFDKSYVTNFQSRITNTIGASMFGVCKCSFKEAVQNINKILNNRIVRKTYHDKQKRRGPLRYWILYRVGSLNSSYMVVMLAKAMQLCNPVYRFFQRKKIYDSK